MKQTPTPLIPTTFNPKPIAKGVVASLFKSLFGGPDKFTTPVPSAGNQDKGPAPYVGNGAPPVMNKWIPPLAMYNDARQWVQLLMFNRPMNVAGADTSNPPLPVQYVSSVPFPNTTSLASGMANVQQQLGYLTIQTAQLTEQGSNFFGSNQ